MILSDIVSARAQVITRHSVNAFNALQVLRGAISRSGHPKGNAYDAEIEAMQAAIDRMQRRMTEIASAVAEMSE